MVGSIAVCARMVAQVANATAVAARRQGLNIGSLLGPARPARPIVTTVGTDVKP